MKTPLERIREGVGVFAVILLGATVGFRYLGSHSNGEPYDWVDAIWMMVITISSVGYGEASSQTHQFQLFSIAVIIFGMSAAAYTIGGLIQMVTEGEVERALGQRRMSRGIEKLSNHVVICGFGRIGRMLSEAFAQQKRPFVLIDDVQEHFEEAQALKFLCVMGDATEEKVLIQAGIERAGSLVIGLPNDAASVFITLTARNLRPDLHIIARAEEPSTEKKLRQAGADRVVLPTVVSARQMVRMIARPSTADLIELMSEGSNLDVELDEFKVPDGSELIGITVRETEAHRKHRLLVVAVEQANGNMVFNPDADYTFEANDTILIMGRAEDIERYKKGFRV